MEKTSKLKRTQKDRGFGYKKALDYPDTHRDNKLIAEFMGCTHPFNEVTDATLYNVSHGTFELSELRYDVSWDWLMLVLKKINIQLNPDNYNDWKLINRPTEYYLEDVYAQVVRFINEYNQNN